MSTGVKAFLDLAPDEFDWQEAAIGRYAVWHMTWDGEDAPDGPIPVFAISEFKPGAVVAPHYHSSDYVSYVVKGDLTVTRQAHQAGDVRFVRAGTAYGPIVIGPEGATVVEVFSDASGSLPHWLGDATDQAQYWPEPYATPEEWLLAERSKRALRPKARQAH